MTEQLERMLMMLLLVAFGGALAAGGLLRGLGWAEVVFALLALLAVRPLAGALALLGARLGTGERLAIGFFGIRGVGSVYYLTYGLNRGEIADGEALWAAMSLTILLSIVLHGVTVTATMSWLDRRRRTRRAGSLRPENSTRRATPVPRRKG